MVARKHYRFEDQAYDQVIAHGGKVPIRTWRVLQSAPGRLFNFLDMTIVPPGGDIGLHTHTEDNEEIYIIISGTGEMVSDGEMIEVGPGDVVMNKPGGSHGLWNTGEVEMKLVVIEIPWGVGEQ